jgi:hypothetical protein
VEILFGTA